MINYYRYRLNQAVTERNEFLQHYKNELHFERTTVEEVWSLVTVAWKPMLTWL